MRQKLISVKFRMLGDDLSVWDFQSSMTFPWLLMIFQSSMTFHDFSRKFYFSRFSRPSGNPGIIWQEPIRACRIQCESPSRRLIELRWSNKDIQLDCFTVDGATLSACIKESVYVRCHVECAALTGNGRRIAVSAVIFSLYPTTRLEIKFILSYLNGLTKYIQTDANE